MLSKSDSLDEALAKAASVETQVEDQLESLGEDDSARRSIAWLAERDLIRWCVPASFGGADTAGLAAPDAVSVQAVAKLRAEPGLQRRLLDE